MADKDRRFNQVVARPRPATDRSPLSGQRYRVLASGQVVRDWRAEHFGSGRFGPEQFAERSMWEPGGGAGEPRWQPPQRGAIASPTIPERLMRFARNPRAETARLGLDMVGTVGEYLAPGLPIPRADELSAIAKDPMSAQEIWEAEGGPEERAYRHSREFQEYSATGLGQWTMGIGGPAAAATIGAGQALGAPFGVVSPRVVGAVAPVVGKMTERVRTALATKVATSMSGGGTLEAGLVKGSFKGVHVDEYTPELVDVYNKAHGTNFTARDIAEKASLNALKESGANHYHASPVCTNFSLLNPNKAPDPNDLAIAKAIARNITEVKPPSVTIENVPQYLNTSLWRIVRKSLDDAGYEVRELIVDAADYGGAQSRKRLIVQANQKGDFPPMPEKTGPVDWYEHLEDLINEQIVSENFDTVGKAFKPRGGAEVNTELANIINKINNPKAQLHDKSPIITMGGGGFPGQPLAGNAGRVINGQFVPMASPTLPATQKSVPRIIIPGMYGLKDAKVIRVTTPMMKRLMGLPDDYLLPESVPGGTLSNWRLSKQVLGNGIHGRITDGFIQPMVDQHALSAIDVVRRPWEVIRRATTAPKVVSAAQKGKGGPTTRVTGAVAEDPTVASPNPFSFPDPYEALRPPSGSRGVEAWKRRVLAGENQPVYEGSNLRNRERLEIEDLIREGSDPEKLLAGTKLDPMLDPAYGRKKYPQLDWDALDPQDPRIQAERARLMNPVATGKEALIGRIRLEVSKGLDPDVGAGATKWIKMLPDEYLDDLGSSYLKGQPAQGLAGLYRPGRIIGGERSHSVIEIAKNIANKRTFLRPEYPESHKTIIHEVAHHLEDFVSPGDAARLKKQWKRDFASNGKTVLEVIRKNRGIKRAGLDDVLTKDEHLKLSEAYRFWKVEEEGKRWIHPETGAKMSEDVIERTIFSEWFAEVLTDKALRDIYMKVPFYRNIIEKVLAKIKVMAEATRKFIAEVLGRGDDAEKVYQKLIKGDYPVAERRYIRSGPRFSKEFEPKPSGRFRPAGPPDQPPAFAQHLGAESKRNLPWTFSKENADFYIQTKGANAGKVMRESSANSVGIKVDPEVLDANYAFYMFQNAEMQGAFKQMQKGTAIPYITQADIDQAIMRLYSQ